MKDANFAERKATLEDCKQSVRLSAKTPAFHVGKRGSIPLRTTVENCTVDVTVACQASILEKWVRLPHSALRRPRHPPADPSCPGGAVWSARHPVKVEITGSNPVRDAVRNIARYANRLSDQSQTLVSVGSTPTRVTGMKRIGWAMVSPGACKTSALRTAGSIPARCTVGCSTKSVSSVMVAHQLAMLEERVRFPPDALSPDG